MADINVDAVEVAMKRVQELVPGAKLKFFVRMNHVCTPAKGLQTHAREFRNAMFQRKQRSRQ